jgi:hypothetical protein
MNSYPVLTWQSMNPDEYKDALGLFDDGDPQPFGSLFWKEVHSMLDLYIDSLGLHDNLSYHKNKLSNEISTT